MKEFLNFPISRLSEYEHLLKAIYNSTRRDHDDRAAIPQVIEVIKDLQREVEPGVISSKQRVQLWQYNAHIVFKPGEVVVCLLGFLMYSLLNDFFFSQGFGSTQ